MTFDEFLSDEEASAQFERENPQTSESIIAGGAQGQVDRIKRKQEWLAARKQAFKDSRPGGAADTTGQLRGLEDYRSGAMAKGLMAQGRQAPQMQAHQLGKESTYQSTQAQRTMMGEDPELRNRQLALGQALAQQAEGGPSLAAIQGRRAQEGSLMAALSGLQGNRASASGAVLAQAGQAGSQAASDAGLMRAQEAMANRNLAAQNFGQGRGQDLDFAMRQAQLDQQLGLRNMDSTNQSRAFGADAFNDRALAQAGIQQRVNSANLGANLDQMGRNDTMEQDWLRTALALDDQEADRRVQRAVSGTALGQQAALQQFATDSARADRALDFIGGLGPAAVTFAGGLTRGSPQTVSSVLDSRHDPMKDIIGGVK